MVPQATRPSFAVIGGGKMGEAIFSGVARSDEGAAAGISFDDMLVVEPNAARRDYLTSEYGVECVEDVSCASMPQGVLKTVILAVKPQVMFDVLASLRNVEAFGGGSDGPLFVSIAAGLTTESLLSALPQGAPLVRVMPNMPLMVGAGASAVCKSASSSDKQVEHVAGLFGCLGRAVVVDESDMDAVCALSGSGPAYVAAMIEAMRDAATACGLKADMAEALALQTVLGTARFIDETGMAPAAAREAICSPGGTTLAALDAMGQAGFAHTIDEGIAAAVRRSKELAQCSR